MDEQIYNTVAFIPIRGGSKSIPFKNIKPINGRPLIYWSLDAATCCEEIDKVFVSTDSIKIRNIVEQYNSDKIQVIGRSEETATDAASTESAMLEFAKSHNFKNIVLIQATSPLLETKYLKDGLIKYFSKDVDSVISVVRQKRFIWHESDGKCKPQNYDLFKRPRRQDFKGFLVENGSFYITSRDLLLKSKCRISGSISSIEMPDTTYVEIDELSDWKVVEDLLKQREGEYINRYDKYKKIKILLTDIDGVLTDGGMYYSENGDELKKFNAKDGMAFQLLRESGINTGIITGENVELVKRRAEKLHVDELYMGVKDKMQVLDQICNKYSINYENIAYVGDDINDLEVIKNVGFGCSVDNAMECIKRISDYVTKSKGGEGAIREITELILSNDLQIKL